MSFELRKIKEVGKVFTGKTPSKAVEDYFGGEIPFVTPTELDKEQFIFSAQQTLTEKGAEQIKLLPKNSVMVCCIGSLGKIGIAGCELATNQQINSVIFDNKKVDFKYGYYVLSRLKPLMEKIAPLTTVPIINKSSFEQLEIPIPPLSTQTQIAQILDKSTALIAKRKAQIAELDKLVQSVFLEMFGDPITNSKNLSTIKLSMLGEWKSGGTPSRANGDFFNGNMPWITSGELGNLYIHSSNEYISEKAIQESAAKIIEKESLLLGMYDTAGLKSSIAKDVVTCNQAIAFAKLDFSMVNNLFVYFCIQYKKEYLLKQQRGVRQKNFNLSMIKDIEILFPILDKQTQFAQIAEKIHAQKSFLQKSLAELEVQHQALMQKAFNGQLVG